MVMILNVQNQFNREESLKKVVLIIGLFERGNDEK